MHTSLVPKLCAQPGIEAADGGWEMGWLVRDGLACERWAGL